MALVLIDRYGQTHSGSSELPGNAEQDGFIRLSLPPAPTFLSFDPSQTSFRAFATTGAILKAANPDRIAVRISGDQAEYRIAGSASEASSILYQALRRAKRVGAFQADRRSVEEQDLEPSYRLLLGLWRDTGGRIDAETRSQQLHEIMSGKFLSVQERTPGDLLEFTSIGKASNVYKDKSWLLQSSGMLVENQPDMKYGLWVQEGYRAAMQQQEPQVDDVDALVYDPFQQKYRRHKYRRMLLPIRGPHDQPMLLSAPIPRSFVEVDIEVANKSS